MNRAQRLDALATANEIRFERARWKRDLKQTDYPVAIDMVADTIAEPSPRFWTMRVEDCLVAAPYVGRAKANRWIAIAGIRQSTTLGELTDRQRTVLGRVLTSR